MHMTRAHTPGRRPYFFQQLTNGAHNTRPSPGVTIRPGSLMRNSSMKRLKPLLCGKSRTPKWLYCQEKSPDLAKFTQNRPVWSVAQVFLAGIASDIFTI